MRKPISRILFTGGVAAVVVVLAATAALAIALTTWNVTPGGSITLTGGKATFKDSATAFGLRCESSSGGGSLKSGHDQRGQDLGSIKTLTFTGCTGPAKTIFSVTASLTVPWTLNATAYNSTTGTTAMPIEGVRFTFSSPAIKCHGTLNGTSAASGNGMVKARYNNTSGQLKVLAGGATLQLASASAGCGALFQVGDPFTFATTFAVSPVQTITGNKIP
jgi:hypothetical protein